jgi:mono/diheme cytochrome c family protein
LNETRDLNVKSQFLRLLLAAALSVGAFAGAAGAADEPPPAEKSEAAAADQKAEPAAPEAAPAGETAAAPAADGAPMKPLDRVNSTEVGKLKNPYTGNAEAIAEGKKLYMGLSCNGCHGGGGGGGMCPPLTNETWVYGGDDDTLFRLITLGSKDLQATGRVRKGQEGVVGPMPPYAELIDDETKLWKIIAWMRTIWTGRPEKATW